MRTLVCDRPGDIAISDRPRPSPGPGRGAGANPPRRRVRHRSSHFRRLASVPRISARHRARIVGRGGGDRTGLRDRRRPAGLRHPLSCLRRLRRLPARQDQLLPAHRRPGRAHRRGHGRLRLRPGSQCGAGRRNHFRSGGDDRIPGDRRPRDPPRQLPARTTAFSSSAQDRSASAACCSGSCRAARSPPSTSARTGSTSAATSLALITRSRRGRTRVKRCPRSPPATSSTS